MRSIDLSGLWDFETDEENRGILEKFYERRLKNAGFHLPGTACENKVGKKQEEPEEFTREMVRAPRERYEYIGPLWLQREIEIPESWAGKRISLVLERVNMGSEVWLDGEKAGRQVISLSVPHRHRLPEKICPGVHVLTLRLDNRDLVNLGEMSSGYSIDTQGIWNGAAGKIRLECEEICGIDQVQIYPEEKGIQVRVTARCGVKGYQERQKGLLRLEVQTPEGRKMEAKTFPVTLYNARQTEHLWYEMEEIQHWDEFSPGLYRLKVSMETPEGQRDEREIPFGMRMIRREGRRFLLNGRPLSLRGTTDCAIHPLTGCPPTDPEAWRKKFRAVKEYGLNYVRFHAWCPPEAAFAAADEAGVYLSVEMPFWLNLDIGQAEAGEDLAHEIFFREEAIRISRAYGNHPSFLLFSNGNEILGDFELLEELTQQMKALDPRRLYTLTSNFDHPASPWEDYFCAFEVQGHPARLQHLQEEAAADTCLDYREAVEASEKPVISFEVGQYAVFPDTRQIEKYQGNMLPVNLLAIRKRLEERGSLGRLDRYCRASGLLAARLYKEDIEAALRTEGLGGFGLLALTDYTGQSTATVGILDAFWESKGILAAEEFRSFCGPVVPLWKSRRIFSEGEILEGETALYDFSPSPDADPRFRLKVCEEGKLCYEAETGTGPVKIPLEGRGRARHLTLSLETKGFRNQWNLFVYPENQEPEELPRCRSKEELLKLMEEGGRAVIFGKALKKPKPGSFVPVFWSPVFFPDPRPCGAWIDAGHPALAEFPTEEALDYQWKELMDSALCADLIGLPDDFQPIVELVPNFVDAGPASPLFAVRVKKALILFCGFDLESQSLPARQLKRSLGAYLRGEEFQNAPEIQPEALLSLLQEGAFGE